jgi:hypothetical protein
VRWACAQARLADFGSLTFTQIGASASTSTGTLRCPAWTATPVQLNPSQSPTPPARTGDAPRTESTASGRAPAAFPSALDADGSTFTVTWLADMTALPPLVSGY